MAALGIPEVMGYTKIVGTPVVTGLYTMLFPMIVFALLGSSRHLVVAADSATAAMVASALAALAIAPADYLPMTSLVAVLAAGMLILARVLRLGFLANFLSRTVLVGFLTGVGIQVAYKQLGGMMGMSNAAIALSVLLFIYLVAYWRPRFPAALVVVIAMITLSYVYGFGARGVALVGDVPQGLPHFALPELSAHNVVSLWSVSFSCFVVILAQSAATSRAYATRYQEHFSENNDLIGLGAANLAAALSGTFVVNGSPTKTAIVDGAGGRTQAAHLTTAAVVLIVLLFLTGPLSLLPEAALAAIVFHIGLSLIDVPGLKDIARKNRGEFMLAILTAVTVVGFGVMPGILLALIVSLLLHVQHSYQPQTALLTLDDKHHWLYQPVGSTLAVVPGFVVFWFGADLFYANAGYFASQIKHLVERFPQPPRWLVIDAGAITDVDYSAGRALAELDLFLQARGVRRVWVHVSQDLLAQLTHLDVFATDLKFATLHEALDAFRAGDRPDSALH